MALNHECNDESEFDPKRELSEMRQFEENEAYNAHWEMMHTYHPDRDFGGMHEYDE